MLKILFSGMLLCSLFLLKHPDISNPSFICNSKPVQNISPSIGPADPEEFKLFIDSLMSTEMKKENVPGAVFVFVKEGKIFFMKGYGLANVEKKIPVDPQKTIFRIGSISKVFTADAILQLADKKKIDLHKDVNYYLHSLKVPVTFSNPVTPAHLINHTAGFDEIRPGTQGPDSASVLPLPTFLRPRLTRLWQPGEIIMYSTYGVTLAGLLIEDVTGKKFDQYLSEFIYNPLEMNRTNINVPSELKQDVAMGYELQNDENAPQQWEWYHTTPASSINSTAEDMAHWLLAHLNEGRYNKSQLMSKKMMQTMLQHQKGMHPNMYGVAYGFFEEYHNDLRFLHHGGNMAGFNSLAVLVPEAGSGFFFAGQHEGSAIRDNLQWAILEKYYKTTRRVKVPTVSTNAKERTKLFTGQYKQNGYCHTCPHPSKTVTFTVTGNPDGTIQLNGRKWIESENELLFIREDGRSKIAFRKDSSGNITHMYFGGIWCFEKIKK